MRYLLLSLLFCCTSLCAGEKVQGHLIMIGGGKRPAAVMEHFFQLAGGKEASIVIIPTASELDDTGSFYQSQFRKDYGLTNVDWLNIRIRAQAAKPKFVKAIDNAAGIFFAGGDQRRIIAAIAGTPVGEAVTRAYLRGAVICGTSAGTACMSPLMLTGEGDFETISAGAVELKPGLGLFRNVILDQHFIERQRQNRLITAVLEHPALLGLGVGESTAVWLKPDHTIEVIGNGTVQVYDASRAQIQPLEKGQPISARHLSMHLLAAGDRFDLKTRK